MSGRPLAFLLIGALVALVWTLGTMEQAGNTPDELAQAPEATPWVATEVLSAVPTPSSVTTPQPPRSASSVSALLTHYLTHLAGSPERRAVWAGHIREVVVGLHTATVRTDLSDSPDDRLLAEEIAGAASRFASSTFGQGVSAPDIEVLGADRQPLASQSAGELARQAARP